MNTMPNVTVITNTFRRNDKRLGEAIKSFLDQDYEDAKLLIHNTHPSHIKISHPRIEVFNNDKVFKRLPERLAYTIDLVKTKYWCVLDDDDILMPWHLSMLLGNWREGYITGHYNSILSRNNSIKKIRDNGWCCFLYTQRSFIEREKKFGALKNCGFDGVIKTSWKRNYLHFPEYLPSYLNRRFQDGRHISLKTHNPEKQQAMYDSNQSVLKEKRPNHVEIVYEINYPRLVKEFLDEQKDKINTTIDNSLPSDLCTSFGDGNVSAKGTPTGFGGRSDY